MANTRTSNQFSVGLWKTLSTSQADYVTDLPILAFASSVTPYLALVVKDKSGDIHRILFSKRGKKDKIIDSFLPEENCSLPQKIVGHTLPLIAEGLGCPNLIDLEGFFGVAMTHIFFDQMLPLFEDSPQVQKWFQNDWFNGKDANNQRDLLEEFDYQKETLETVGVELVGKKGKKESSTFASSLDALRATQSYMAFRSRKAISDNQLVHRSKAHLPLKDSVLLVDHLSQSDVQEAQIRNLKRAFNAGGESYASLLAVSRSAHKIHSSPIAVNVRPHYEFNTLAFDLSKTSYNSFVAWEIRRNSNLMLLA